MMGDVAFFTAGLLTGSLYFALLRWNASLYIQAGNISFAAGLQIVRLVALGGMLAMIALQGAVPLLLAAFGVFVARPFVMRMVAA